MFFGLLASHVVTVPEGGSTGTYIAFGVLSIAIALIVKKRHNL